MYSEIENYFQLSTVILEGAIPSQDRLSRLADVARGVDGAKAVETDLVKVATV